jgi:predicted Ser/Thr protein kinase
VRTVGDYTLLGVLGEGGMGVVHLARNEVTGDRVALKILRPQIVGDEEGRRRLAREVSSLRRVHSRWVAEIVDADPWGPVPYVVMRYVPGRSLHDEIAEDGPVRGRDLHWLARCLLDAVAAVHEGGVLHRDVKPSNVIMEGRTPVLIDFGLARVADDPKITHTGWLLGTPGYLPPEILRGDDATPASDVHSWAATVAFAATGRPPYGKGPSAAIMDRARRGEHDLSDIEPDLRRVLDAALSPDPALRPTVAELQAWLRHPGRPLPGRTAERPARHPDLPEEAAPRTLAILEPDDAAPDETVGAPGEGATTSSGERVRRVVLGAGLAALAAVGFAAYPWASGAVILVLVALLRGLSLAGSVHGERRELRGARWYDGPRLIVGTPWHLLRSLPSTVVLVLWAGGLAVAVGLLCYAVAAATPVMLLACGLTFAVMLACGPGGSRVRGPAGALLRPAARTGRRWCITLLVLIAAAAYLGVRLHAGVDWAPAGGPPLTGLG